MILSVFLVRLAKDPQPLYPPQRPDAWVHQITLIHHWLVYSFSWRSTIRMSRMDSNSFSSIHLVCRRSPLCVVRSPVAPKSMCMEQSSITPVIQFASLVVLLFRQSSLVPRIFNAFLHLTRSPVRRHSRSNTGRIDSTLVSRFSLTSKCQLWSTLILSAVPFEDTPKFTSLARISLKTMASAKLSVSLTELIRQMPQSST